MKFKDPKIWWLSVLFVLFYVHYVHAQFSKGVVRNNVFAHYVNGTDGGSSDHLIYNQSATNLGYSSTKAIPTMVSDIQIQIMW